MSGQMSHDDDHLDFNKIEKEVQDAVVNEARYWRENDAKFRAVEQKVPTYDDFRDMVLAAHLQPLEKGDKISDMGTFTQVWNQAARGQKSTDGIEGDNTQNITKTTTSVPKSGQEFAQIWRRLPKNPADKKQFLLSIGPENISNLFKTEITDGLLGQFFNCLLSFDVSETGIVFGLMEAFSKSQRFSLSLAFLTENEKFNGAHVFAKLKHAPLVQDSPELTEKVTELEKVYKFG